MSDSDVIVIGAGHNGLVCAAYLARAGLRVTVLERRPVVGGVAVTEEFHPGFRNSVASYTVSLLQPKVIRDLDLPGHGLQIVQRRVQNFLPLDGGYLATGPGRTAAEVSKFSPRDAARLDAYEARLQGVTDVLRDLVLRTPPQIMATGWSALREALTALPLLRQLGGLGVTAKRDLLTFFGTSAGDWLDGWFESDPIKAVLGFDGVVGNYASPYTPGSAYVLLHHCFGEVNGQRGVWGHAIGGMGAITQAIAAAARSRGATILTDAPVAEVLIRNRRTTGVVTADGRRHTAPVVVSNLNPKLLFERLVEPALLPTDFRERMARYTCASGTFRMNVALSRLPSFTCLPGAGDHLTAGIIIAPSLRYMEQAFADARAHGWSREPIVEMLIPSTLDPSLAPAGAHVASLFCQHVSPDLPESARDTVADLMIRTVDRHAPGFAASVIARQVFSPRDLERTFGLVGGDIMHGALRLDQMFAARPVLGHGDYRTPIAGLYQCGAGTHPGGGVTGAPGHNAAAEILKDLRRH